MQGPKPVFITEPFILKVSSASPLEMKGSFLDLSLGVLSQADSPLTDA